ncbi:MAG: KEOPS complex kinase/ATPase Bud32, partial [Candidatus Nanohaloarchaea archaeon]|nr:KEOPS complex kinase/ATPase Bud32 [Candidatus Nanohaloarchaea archaeon]
AAYLGAEARVHVESDAAVKKRISKQYRHDALDKRLRRERTEQEARLLEKARQTGVNVPAVEEAADSELRMERIEGTLLREVFGDSRDIWPRIGEAVARLHARNIIHGDLTTSNMILSDDELYLIDFGLGFFSERVEDRATDLHLLKEVLDSTHTGVADAAMDDILAAYRGQADDADAVLERFDEIEGRGRYTS